MTKRKQPLLFADLPRRNNRVLMDIIDAGVPSGDSGHLTLSKCGVCDYEGCWMISDTLTEAKQKQPCPKCNKTEEVKAA